jgi:hypothetical protein
MEILNNKKKMEKGKLLVNIERKRDKYESIIINYFNYIFMFV